MNDTQVDSVVVIDPVELLNDRERVIFHMLASGLSNRQIAGEVALAEKTVKNYVTAVLRKLGMHSRSDVIAYVSSAAHY